MEQEKHRLRCELEVMEEEYEQRITELQSDLSGIFKFSMRTLLILHKHKNLVKCTTNLKLVCYINYIILAMRERLHEAEMTTRYHDRERQSLVTQLSEQNGRLTSELQAASRREEELQGRLSELRSQVNDKRLSMQDHILYLENLKDEVIDVKLM